MENMTTTNQMSEKETLHKKNDITIAIYTNLLHLLKFVGHI